MDIEPPARICSVFSASSDPATDSASARVGNVHLAPDYSPQASVIKLFDWRSFELIKVLFAVAKKDDAVTRIYCSNSICARRSSSSVSPFSVMLIGFCISLLYKVLLVNPSFRLYLFIKTLCERAVPSIEAAADPKPEVEVWKNPLPDVMPKP